MLTDQVVFACALALLEMTFVFVGLMLTHALRKHIGAAAFYLSLGLLLIFTQLVDATELKVNVGYHATDFFVAHTVLFLPYLATLMVIYATEGTLATQRVILGAMAALGLYLYLSQTTAEQCGWAGKAISQGPSADSLEYLLRQSKLSMASSIFAQTLDMFLIPIIFQRLRSWKCRLFLSVLGALMVTQMTHTLVFVTATYWNNSLNWWMHIRSSYISNAIATIWLSMLATLYLHKIERERPGEGEGVLDIIFAFLGSYGKARMLEKNLLEWEGRYRMVVENASDMILLLDGGNRVMDANLAALEIFNIPDKESIMRRVFPQDFVTLDERGLLTMERWGKLFKLESISDTQRICGISVQAVSDTGREVELDVAVSHINVENAPVTIVFGRDVTEQSRLNREHEDLRKQLVHVQRLESVGRLAGGIAHDFNNYLHALQGHLDILLYMRGVKDEKIASHLKRMDKITEQAAELTRKLLGFARKGKYIDSEFDLNDLIRESVDLFMPGSQRNIDLGIESEIDKPIVKGDRVQLQQVFLNMLINARDAMENVPDNRVKINITITDGANTPARKATRGSTTPTSRRKYWCVIVRDYGEGMDKSTLAHLFEPFFTTKPVGKGTGMGLAMVYGTISNHGGFINVESEKGKGTAFRVFLPKARPDGFGMEGKQADPLDKTTPNGQPPI